MFTWGVQMLINFLSTAKDRYLAILNTPLLQNKLPEHIQEQAVLLKPYIQEFKGAPCAWIDSIE